MVAAAWRDSPRSAAATVDFESPSRAPIARTLSVAGRTPKALAETELISRALSRSVPSFLPEEDARRRVGVELI